MLRSNGRMSIASASLPFPSFKERMECYLLVAAKRSTTLDSTFAVFDPPLRAIAYCSSGEELQVIVQHLKSEGHLEVLSTVNQPPQARLTPKGHMFGDE